jgi:hypothetical protein
VLGVAKRAGVLSLHVGHKSLPFYHAFLPDLCARQVRGGCGGCGVVCVCVWGGGGGRVVVRVEERL